MRPTVGRDVHYMSLGSKNGEYLPQCRAAKVTEVLSQTELSLCVFNPTGLFFNTCQQDEDKAGGTWHWPERVD